MERAERMLADAITIDGRKEGIFKFCSGTTCLDPLALHVLFLWHKQGCEREEQRVVLGIILLEKC